MVIYLPNFGCNLQRTLVPFPWSNIKEIFEVTYIIKAVAVIHCVLINRCHNLYLSVLPVGLRRDRTPGLGLPLPRRLTGGLGFPGVVFNMGLPSDRIPPCVKSDSLTICSKSYYFHIVNILTRRLIPFTTR